MENVLGLVVASRDEFYSKFPRVKYIFASLMSRISLFNVEFTNYNSLSMCILGVMLWLIYFDFEIFYYKFSNFNELLYIEEELEVGIELVFIEGGRLKLSGESC